MLSIQGVTYRYAGARTPSLRDLDLSLRDGEVVGLVGANDAGKSTLCLVASGLAPRAIRGSLSGVVTIDGDDVSAWPMYRMASSVGMAFQNPSTQLSGVTETVFEEVCFGPMNLGTPKDELIGRAERALEALHITDLAGRRPDQLSGGQMQLVAVAGLLAMAPRHLVLDEPTAQLDPRGTRLVSDALVELAARGTSILIAEHKTDLLDRLCSRIVVLDGGRIALDGLAGDILADDRLPGLGVAQPARVQLERAVAAQSNPP